MQQVGNFLVKYKLNRQSIYGLVRVVLNAKITYNKLSVASEHFIVDLLAFITLL